MSPWLIAAGIALLPILCGGRVASQLAGARWVLRRPRAALVVWQAIGLAGGLGAVGVGLVAAVGPLAAAFPHGMHTFWHQILDGGGLARLGFAHVAALAWSVTLIAWLLFHTVRTTVRTAAEQRRQRLLVDVAADPWGQDWGQDAYVLPTAEPVAYCVPGRRARIVLSRGTMDLLSTGELRAVLAHERAHARGRHDLVLLPFVALALAFPWLPAARIARDAVPALLEMLADDRARRTHEGVVLARAIVRMATREPSPGFALADSVVVERVGRLLRGHADDSGWVPALAYSAAVLLLSGPLAVWAAPVICTRF